MRRATETEIAAYRRMYQVFTAKTKFYREEYDLNLFDARDRVLKDDNAQSVNEYFERRKVFIKYKISINEPTEYYWYEYEYNAVNGAHS